VRVRGHQYPYPKESFRWSNWGEGTRIWRCHRKIEHWSGGTFRWCTFCPQSLSERCRAPCFYLL